MTTSTKTAEELYAEYVELRDRPLSTPHDWRNPSEEFIAKGKMMRSLWELYATTSELETLTLREQGQKKAAIRQETLCDVRRRVVKDLQHALTVKVATKEWGMGYPAALDELMSSITYRRAAAEYVGTPYQVLDELLDELARSKRRYDGDLFSNLAKNYGLEPEYLDRLIRLARSPENYALLVSHPNLTAEQFARIAVKAPSMALLREAGYLYRWEGTWRTSPYEVIPIPALPLPQELVGPVMNAVIREGSSSGMMLMFLDPRSTLSMKRRALTRLLPGRGLNAEGAVVFRRTLRERLAALDAVAIRRLSPEARAMLVLYPHTPKRVLAEFAKSGITSDSLMRGAKYPYLTILYPAVLKERGRAIRL